MHEALVFHMNLNYCLCSVIFSLKKSFSLFYKLSLLTKDSFSRAWFSSYAIEFSISEGRVKQRWFKKIVFCYSNNKPWAVPTGIDDCQSTLQLWHSVILWVREVLPLKSLTCVRLHLLNLSVWHRPLILKVWSLTRSIRVQILMHHHTSTESEILAVGHSRLF